MLREPQVHIVDDDEGMRRALARLIRAEGWAAETYEDGRAFLDAPRPTRPSCVVLDIRMPEVDGFAVHEALRSEGSDIPTILLTGDLDPRTCELARRAGADEFLTKPLEERALLDAVRRGFERQREVGVGR